ncbi:MAG: hypothetical protein ACOX7I_06505 [Oscillospiraceae bacterium]
MAAQGVHARSARTPLLARFHIRVAYRYGKKQGINRQPQKGKREKAKDYYNWQACRPYMGKGLKADGYGKQQGAQWKQKPQGIFPEKYIVEVTEKEQYERKDPQKKHIRLPIKRFAINNG